MHLVLVANQNSVVIISPPFKQFNFCIIISRKKSRSLGTF